MPLRPWNPWLSPIPTSSASKTASVILSSWPRINVAYGDRLFCAAEGPDSPGATDFRRPGAKYYPHQLPSSRTRQDQYQTRCGGIHHARRDHADNYADNYASGSGPESGFCWGVEWRFDSPARLSDSATTCSAIARAPVAAGDGALRT